MPFRHQDLAFGRGALRMFSSIRSRLLGLVLATVVPFTALIAFGLWSQRRTDEALANERAIGEATQLAAEVDDHLGNLESLLIGLVHAVSTNPAKVAENDAVLFGARSEFDARFPGVIGTILLISPDGTVIGRSTDEQTRATYEVRDRKYFQQVLSGRKLVIGDVIHGRVSGQWLLPIARSVDDSTGRLRAVLAVSILLENFQNTLRMDRLPAGSIVTIVNEQGVVLARNVESQKWVGRSLGRLSGISRRFAKK